MFQCKRILPTSPSRPSAKIPSFESDGNYAVPKTAAATRGIGGGKDKRDKKNREGEAGLKAESSEEPNGGCKKEKINSLNN